MGPYLLNPELAKVAESERRIRILINKFLDSTQMWSLIKGLLEYDYWAEDYLTFFLKKNPI